MPRDRSHGPGEPGAPSTRWEALREAFLELAPKAHLQAEHYGGRPGIGDAFDGVDGEWAVRAVSGPTKYQREFIRLARLAAVEMGYPDSADSWVYWLHELRLADLPDMQRNEWHFTSQGVWKRPVPPEAAVTVALLDPVCDLSADYCRRLSRGLMAPARPASLRDEEIGRQVRQGGQKGGKRKAAEAQKRRAAWLREADAIRSKTPGLSQRKLAERISEKLKDGEYRASPEAIRRALGRAR